MPGDPSPKGSSGTIIAYNNDSARGWNDPPTFAFSNNSTGNRPKLDLRKRVSHQQALHGVQAPSPVLQASVIGTKDDLVNGVAGLHLNGVKQPFYTPPPVTTTPLGNNIFTPPGLPAAFTRSVSTPSFSSETVTQADQSPAYLSQAENPRPPHAHAKSTDNVPGNLGQPLFDLKDHSFEPVRTAPFHSIRSNPEIGDHLDDQHNSHSSPEIFHPIAPPITTAPSMPNYQATQAAVTPPPPLPYQPLVGQVTPPLYRAHCHSPVLPPAPTQGAGGPVVHSVTPPLPPGNHIASSGSLSAGNTPRSTSPSSQEKNEDIASTMDDSEGLKVTMDALQDVINKLHDTLEKRVADDISRRLQIMARNWTNGKLSQGVKSRMINLAQALDDGNVEEAHQIHVSLMVDFVAEVNQWMVAVKKLINLVRSSNAFSTHS